MAAKDIIGQFGVGFYSAFMVATKIEVYSKSSTPGSTGVLWTSDGSGTYSIQVQRVAHHCQLVRRRSNLRDICDFVTS